MKEKYVPLDKRTKREQREYHAKQRRDWGEISPITKKAANQKLYNRKKSKHRQDYEPGLDFFNASFAAFCSASFLLRPLPSPIFTPMCVT